MDPPNKIHDIAVFLGDGFTHCEFRKEKNCWKLLVPNQRQIIVKSIEIKVLAATLWHSHTFMHTLILHTVKQQTKIKIFPEIPLERTTLGKLMVPLFSVNLQCFLKGTLTEILSYHIPTFFLLRKHMIMLQFHC